MLKPKITENCNRSLYFYSLPLKVKFANVCQKGYHMERLAEGQLVNQLYVPVSICHTSHFWEMLYPCLKHENSHKEQVNNTFLKIHPLWMEKKQYASICITPCMEGKANTHKLILNYFKGSVILAIIQDSPIITSWVTKNILKYLAATDASKSSFP